MALWWKKKATNEADWSPDQTVLSSADINGDMVELHNIRNCQYTDAEHYEVRHYDKTFNINDLKRVWYIVAPFSMKGIAHVFVSFEFVDKTYLAISIEARRRRGEIYSLFKGFFNGYELMYIIGNEEDLIKIRTNHRSSPVYLYPLRAPKPFLQKLFLDMLGRANKLVAEPEFYNTLFNNCSENLVRHVNAIAPKTLRWGWYRLFLDYSDRFLYKLGLIDSQLPFPDLRRQAQIDALAETYAHDLDFSEKIRVRSLTY